MPRTVLKIPVHEGVETQIMLSVRLETEPLVSSGDESTVAAEVPTCAGILDVAETARVEPVATQAQEESEEWSDSANAPSAQLIDDLFADSRYSDDTLATLFGHEVLRLVQVQRAMLPSRGPAEAEQGLQGMPWDAQCGDGSAGDPADSRAAGS